MVTHLRKVLYALMVLILIFGCIFLVTLANTLRNQAILGIGLPVLVENGVTMAFSVIAIIRIVWEIIFLERD